MLLDPAMSAQSPVVVGYDFSHSGHAALSRAVVLAGRAPHHVLHILCVIDPKHALPTLPHDGEIDYRYAARVQEALAAVTLEELERAGVTARVQFVVHAKIGKPVEEILELAKSIGADLIIVGSHGLTGLERLIVGSTAEKIVRDAGCTVEVARAKQYADVDVPPAADDTLPPHEYEYDDHHLVARVLASR